MLFQPRQHPFLSIIFTASMFMALKRADLLVMRCKIRNWRWTELLWMLEMITNGTQNHVGSQTFGKVRHCLVDVFL